MTTKLHRTNVFKSPLMRVAFAQGLFTSRTSTRDDGSSIEKFDCTLILPLADKEGLAVLQKAVAEVVMAQWGEKGLERFAKGFIKNPILKGDGKEAHDKEGNLRAGLGPDICFIRVGSGKKPGVYNHDVLPAKEEDVRSGYWGYAALNAYAWHNAKNGDGVSFGIDMFQVVKPDEILGGSGRIDPSALFDRIRAEVEQGKLDPGIDASAMFG